MDVKCLIFDLDDTLVSDFENKRGAFQFLLSFLNLSYSEQMFLEWNRFDHDYWSNGIYQQIKVPIPFCKTKEGFTKYVRSMRFPMFFGNTDHSPFVLNDIYQKGLFQRIVPIEGACEVITYFQKYYPIYIATNGVSEVAVHKLKQIGLSSYFQGIFSADMTKNTVTKANILFWKEFLEFIKDYRPKDCLIIGDNYRDDICIPKSLGFHTCLVHPGDYADFQGDYHIKRLKELKQII